MVKPVDPVERRDLHGLEVVPRAATTDDLGLVQSDDRLCEIIIVGVTRREDERDRLDLDCRSLRGRVKRCAATPAGQRRTQCRRVDGTVLNRTWSPTKKSAVIDVLSRGGSSSCAYKEEPNARGSRDAKSYVLSQ